VIKYFVIWTSLSQLSYDNGSQRTQNNKQATAGKTMDITIPEKQQIKSELGKATSQSVIQSP
jgi:hypothetical protein